MSQQTPIFTTTRVPVAAVAAKRFVDFTGAQIGVAGTKAMGVADYAVAAGVALPIHVIGTAIVETGGAFADGALIKSDATGRAIVQGGAGEILGYAQQASGAAGQFVEVLLAL